jgi:hypothetical protein
MSSQPQAPAALSTVKARQVIIAQTAKHKSRSEYCGEEENLFSFPQI